MVEFYFYFRLLTNSTCICAVVGCSNNTYHLRNWKADFRKLHNCKFGTRIYVCNPPFMLFPFPTENKDKERRQRWIKNFNRKDPNTGKLWNPTYNDSACQYTLLMENKLRKIQILVYTWDMTQLLCIQKHAFTSSEENL